MKNKRTIKENKVFYRERQKFFDAVNNTRNGENPIITYNKERYKLIYPIDQDGDLDHKEDYGFLVMFNKARKSHSIYEYHNGNRNGLSIWGDHHWSRFDFTRILCYAEKINDNENN